MPEYLAPGVYLEETSFRAKSIEGVSTTTTGFIGPTRYGPTDRTPEVLTSLNDFEQTYGDGQPLVFNGVPVTNWMWQAARAFFEEGGQLLYVVRTYRPAGTGPAGGAGGSSGGAAAGGRASSTVGPLRVEARWPGAYGQLAIQLSLSLGQNILSRDTQNPVPNTPKVNGLQDKDVVWIGRPEAGGLSYAGDFYLAHLNPDQTWEFEPVAGAGGSPPGHLLPLVSISPPGIDPTQNLICRVTLGIAVTAPVRDALPQVWSGLPLDPSHATGNTADSVFDTFISDPSRPDADSLPVIITVAGAASTPPADGLKVLTELTGVAGAGDLATLGNNGPGSSASYSFLLDGGDDGAAPSVSDYEGDGSPNSDAKTGLVAFEDLDDISIVAAPGATYNPTKDSLAADRALTVIDLLIAHCTKMRYRIAVIDSGDQQSLSEVRQMRAKIDSEYAAFYYPWVRILDPVTQVPLDVPPSGFVAGIYARNDINRGVYKAPANEVVNLAIGFEKFINKGQQEVLNPEGINCFRYFPGRGYRLWGARLASSDPEWKYVNLRRYFAYLEHSIDKGTQWAVFEPNNEALWTKMRHTIEPFLLNEFVNGALLGDKPEQAYFVRCDRSTMTQNDLDNGRLVVLVGVAAVRPAEFVIIRIGQWTADAQK